MTEKELSDKELTDMILKLSEELHNFAFLLKQSRLGSSKDSDEETTDDLHKLAMEDKIPEWVMCGGSD